MASIKVIFAFLGLIGVIQCQSRSCSVTPSIGVRVNNSDVIVKGTVLQRIHSHGDADDIFSVDVMVTEIYKGYQRFNNVSSETIQVPFTDVTNVYRIVGFHKDPCLTSVSAHQEYIFFLTTRVLGSPHHAMLLSPLFEQERGIDRRTGPLPQLLHFQYQNGVVDAVIKYSSRHEKDMLSSLGWRHWLQWTFCDNECGGSGTQTRRRTCIKDMADACEGPAVESRECNKFPCSKTRNLQTLMNLHEADGVRFPDSRNSAFRITAAARISIPTSMIYTRVFPDEFSILLILKLRPSQMSLDDSIMYPLVIVDNQNNLQLAVQISRNPSIVYGTPDGIETIIFEEYNLNREWHYLAFSITSDAVTLIADCTREFVRNLPDGDTIYVDVNGYTAIGSPPGGVAGLSDITFTGDLDQFLILDDPDAARLQCLSTKRMLPSPSADLLDIFPMPTITPTPKANSNADVHFTFDLRLVNLGYVPTDNIDVVPKHSTRIPVVQHPTAVQVTKKRQIPPIVFTAPPKRQTTYRSPNEIIEEPLGPRGDKPDFVFYPSTTPDVITHTVVPYVEQPFNIISRTTVSQGIITERTSIKGYPANLPENMQDIDDNNNDIAPPGEEYPRDDPSRLFGGLASGDEFPPQEGVEWSTWSTCTTTCGLGTRYRFGFCQKDSTYVDCTRGHTITSQRKNCQLHNCPGELQWSSWSSCSQTCGASSIMTRMAFCPDERSHPDCVRPGQTVVERKRCTDTVPDCQDVCEEDCRNGGNCMDGLCICPPGYTGQYCQHQTCNPQCGNGGVCLGNNFCNCPVDTNQPYCARRCLPDCVNGGLCVSGNICECPPGYTGSRCETPICNSQCRNGGHCIGPDQCKCQRGYSGADCRQAICILGCDNGGTCLKPDYCRCPTGYRGIRCQIGYCRVSCKNGGECIGADTCKCTRGFTGFLCQSSKCSRGCPPGLECIGRNKCLPISRKGNSGARRKSWCPLTSYSQRVQVSYVKPVIRNLRVSCGSFGLQKCNSQRLEYTIAYKTAYKTAYRCTGNQ